MARAAVFDGLAREGRRRKTYIFSKLEFRSLARPLFFHSKSCPAIVVRIRGEIVSSLMALRLCANQKNRSITAMIGTRVLLVVVSLLVNVFWEKVFH